MKLSNNRSHISDFGSSGGSPGSRPGPPSKPSVVISLSPRLLTIPTPAASIASTNWHVEELYRADDLPYLLGGKHRVIDVRDLDDRVSRQTKQTGMPPFKLAGAVLVAAIEGVR